MGSWGYHRDESTWKSNKQLVVLLIETVSKGGNLLLNVGPTARGTFDDRAKLRLKEIGEWMKFQNRSIYGCTQTPEEFKRLKNEDISGDTLILGLPIKKPDVVVPVIELFLI